MWKTFVTRRLRKADYGRSSGDRPTLTKHSNSVDLAYPGKHCTFFN